ncbi:hemerythrin domain-containing protein [Dactylosporangium sp. NPDC000244]|uniref:hemerythrin domain-containing protein n=1 Tax=Dactylosporangium sp. NPDC000244 TaxID=3154365 RepID=UPI0033241046
MTDEPEPDRVRAAREQLAAIHDMLRRDLAAARRDPRAHCLAFCAALSGHHGNEDAVFPRIERAFPQAAPLIARLRDDHRRIASQIAAEPDTDTLERMAAELEEHFAVEEAELVPLISRL